MEKYITIKEEDFKAMEKEIENLKEGIKKVSEWGMYAEMEFRDNPPRIVLKTAGQTNTIQSIINLLDENRKLRIELNQVRSKLEDRDKYHRIREKLITNREINLSIDQDRLEKKKVNLTRIIKGINIFNFRSVKEELIKNI